jgi:integrase
MPLKIYKRGGIWHYRGTVAGHRLRGSTRTEDRKTAARFASEIQNRQYQRGTDAVDQALTFPKAVSLYLAAGKPDRYIDRLEDYWKNTRVSEINSGAIKQSALDLYPNAKGSTRNRQVIVPTQAIINHCAERQLCQPIKIARFKFETKIKQPVTLEWVNALRAHADRPDIGVLALFMFATGARIKEALSVQWDDIDMRKRTVLIRQTKLGNERVAHLPQDLFIAIANLPRRNEPRLAKPFAFASHSSALAAWERAVAAAGIEPLTFHSCRHGFATALLHRGVDVVTIAKLGGWKSAAHVLKTYGHAHNDATLTDRIFDTQIDTAKTNRSENSALARNARPR